MEAIHHNFSSGQSKKRDFFTDLLGAIVWNSGKFHVQSIQGNHGFTLSLKTYFRDTKIGDTRKFSLRLGLRVSDMADGRVEPLIVKIMIDDKEVPTPPGLEYWLEKKTLKIIQKNQLVLEVNL